jgi:hypothetical protein
MVELDKLAILLKQIEQRVSDSFKQRNFDEVFRLTRMAKDLETARFNSEAIASKVSAALASDGQGAPGDKANGVVTNDLPVLDELSNKARGNRLREEWLQNAMNRGVRLHHVKGVVYETESGKRVGIPSASEVLLNKWWLGLPDERFDFVVLLCQPKAGELLDFVLPSELVAKVWPLLSRHGDHKKIHVEQSGINYKLEPGAGFFPIKEYLSRFEVLSS